MRGDSVSFAWPPEGAGRDGVLLLIFVRLLELLPALLLFIGMYWSPTLIAIGRRAWNWPAIALVNTLVGWTLIGWVIAFAWSVVGKPAVLAATNGNRDLTQKPKSSWAIFAPMVRRSRLSWRAANFSLWGPSAR